jgi:DivIVA domain-containing protein
MIASADVNPSTFTTTRFREGYDTDEVDSFLARVKTTLEAYERRSGGFAGITAAQVVTTRFQPTKYRLGYNQDQVDALLDQVVTALQYYEKTRKPTIL